MRLFERLYFELILADQGSILRGNCARLAMHIQGRFDTNNKNVLLRRRRELEMSR